MFELDFQKRFKNIEFFEIFEFFEADLLVAPPLLDFPGDLPGKTLEKLKNLKHLNVFKGFSKNQLKNLPKIVEEYTKNLLNGLQRIFQKFHKKSATMPPK